MFSKILKLFKVEVILNIPSLLHLLYLPNCRDQRVLMSIVDRLKSDWTNLPFRKSLIFFLEIYGKTINAKISSFQTKSRTLTLVSWMNCYEWMTRKTRSVSDTNRKTLRQNVFPDDWDFNSLNKYLWFKNFFVLDQRPMVAFWVLEYQSVWVGQKTYRNVFDFLAVKNECNTVKAAFLKVSIEEHKC